MNKTVVALLQISACSTDLVSNQAKGEAYCRQAATMGADITLFPELWSVGYSPCPTDSFLCQGWLDLARDRDSDFVEHTAGHPPQRPITRGATRNSAGNHLPRFSVIMEKR